MFLRYFKCKKVQTVKIAKCYFTDVDIIAKERGDKYNSNGILGLELKMNDGSVHHIEIEPRLAFKKYCDFFDNHKDENYHHNQNMIRQNNLLDLYYEYEDVIPMHENPDSHESRCVLS